MIISKKEFHSISREILEKIIFSFPDDMRSLAKTVVVRVSDNDEKENEDLLGIFEGEALSDSHIDEPLHPNAITLYYNQIRKSCRTEKELRTEIEITLLHEFAHFFGFDEEDMERFGLE